MTKAKTIKMPMNDTDKRAAFALAGCTFLPGSYNKRFAKAMSFIANRNEPAITDRQRITLYKLVYMHRRQIADQELLTICKPFYDAEQ